MKLNQNDLTYRTSVFVVLFDLHGISFVIFKSVVSFSHATPL